VKVVTIIKALLGVGFLTALGFETGLLQRAFDSRSVLEDGVVGSGFLIEEVDGKPVERVRHGFLISRVPFALVVPGERVLGLSVSGRSSGDSELVEFRAAVKRGVNYRISRDGKGNPELVVVE
jgi:hypothetical protein